MKRFVKCLMITKILIISIFPICGSVIFLPSSLSADCASFYGSFDNLLSVKNNNGVIAGSLSFTPSIIKDGANFDGNASIKYSDNIFDSESGTVSLWFKKNSADQQGGIMQIGQTGLRNSIGLFYNFESNIYFEIRNENNNLIQAYATNALSQSEFKHIVATWDKRENNLHIKLFVNGKFVDGNLLSGSFNYDNAFLEVGSVGYYGKGKGIIDEIRFFNRQLSDPEIYAEYVYSSNKYRYRETIKPVSTGPIKIINKTLSVNGNPFTVKGVGYQPIPVGLENSPSTLNAIYTDPALIHRDMKLLRAMNANTIRLWAGLPDETLLDALYNNGVDPIYAIMAFEVPTAIDYSDPAEIESLESEFRDYVNQFKHHSAILAWSIGNENNLHYDGNIADWFTLADKLAKVAYEEEFPAYHPTMVINGYMLHFADSDYKSDDISMSYTDIWGHNSYTGYSFNCYFDYYNKLTAKPLVITEFGIDAYDTVEEAEYEDIQAVWVENQWNEINNNSLGGTIMEYSDEWWKGMHHEYPEDSQCPDFNHYLQSTCGYYTDVQPDGFSNEEWWGITKAIDNGPEPDILEPRSVYYTLQSLWQDLDVQYLNRIQSVYIAYYLRPADPGGMYWWAAQLRDRNGDLSAIIDAFATSEESLRLWGEINSGNIGEVIDDVYDALFNRPADAGGKQFYVDGFNAGQFTPGTIVLNILDGAQNEDRQAIENKLTYSNYFVSVLDPDGDWQGPYEATYDAQDEQTARDLLDGITWDSDIITEQQVRDDVMNYIADPGDPILD